MDRITKGKKLVGLLAVFFGPLMMLITFGKYPVSFGVWCLCVAGGIVLLIR